MSAQVAVSCNLPRLSLCDQCVSPCDHQCICASPFGHQFQFVEVVGLWVHVTCCRGYPVQLSSRRDVIVSLFGPVWPPVACCRMQFTYTFLGLVSRQKNVYRFAIVLILIGHLY